MASNELNGNGDSPPSKIRRRIQPTKIGDVQEKRSSEDSLKEENEIVLDPSEAKDSSAENVRLSREVSESNNAERIESTEELMMEVLPEIQEQPEDGPSTSKELASKNEHTRELAALIEACRNAEPSADMKQVIKKKLLKYYHLVHPDYVKSKNFLKSLRETANEINKEPHLVYVKLKEIIDELDIRRKSKTVVVTNEDSVEIKGTGDEAKDLHLKKLQKGLVKLKRTIDDLDQAEVDWDDDENSSYLKKSRFEKRASQIYKEICDITGESSHAHRIVKKPIKFKGTDFQAFNVKLQKLVNKKKSFPNYLDVLKLLDYCNKTHNFGLTRDQLRPYAQDAFEKLGKALQKRRKDDFYESAVCYVGKTKDPAKDDPELRAQLEKNKKFYGKCDDIINE